MAKRETPGPQDPRCLQEAREELDTLRQRLLHLTLPLRVVDVVGLLTLVDAIRTQLGGEGRP